MYDYSEFSRCRNWIYKVKTHDNWNIGMFFLVDNVLKIGCMLVLNCYTMKIIVNIWQINIPVLDKTVCIMSLMNLHFVGLQSNGFTDVQKMLEKITNFPMVSPTSGLSSIPVIYLLTRHASMNGKLHSFYSECYWYDFWW